MGGLNSFDKRSVPVFHLTISIICFTIDTALSSNKETNIVIVGVVIAEYEEKPCNQ